MANQDFIPPKKKEENVVIGKLDGRDRISAYAISKKLNELIDRFNELCQELAQAKEIKKE